MDLGLAVFVAFLSCSFSGFPLFSRSLFRRLPISPEREYPSPPSPQRVTSFDGFISIGRRAGLYLRRQPDEFAGITEKLFRFADVLVGRLYGGLAQVNIVASLIFPGRSGAALADVGGSAELRSRR